MMNILNRLICLIKGHDPYRQEWKTEYRISLNRKGKKKKGKGIRTFKNKHYEEICLRCGKVLKKR